jgi:hypothetical protein
MRVCCGFCLSGLLHGTYWKNYRFFKGVQRGMQKPLWITPELLISNVFRDAKVLPLQCKSPNPLWGTGAPATVRCRRTKPATRAGGPSASCKSPEYPSYHKDLRSATVRVVVNAKVLGTVEMGHNPPNVHDPGRGPVVKSSGHSGRGRLNGKVL